MNNYPSCDTRYCPYCGEYKVFCNTLVIPPHRCKVTEADVFKMKVLIQIYGEQAIKLK